MGVEWGKGLVRPSRAAESKGQQNEYVKGGGIVAEQILNY